MCATPLLLLVMTLGIPAAASAPPKAAMLVVECPIAGATVTIDGREIGKTPLATQTLSVGAHTVKVRKLGYLEFTESVEARSGATIRVSADLLPFAGILKVTSNVAGARVLVDGRVVGQAPGEFEVKIGRRTVVVVAPGHRDHKETLMMSAGNLYAVEAKLAKGETPTATSDLELDLVPLEPASPDKKSGAAKSAATGRTQAGSVDDDLELEPLLPELPAPKPKSASTNKTLEAPTAAPSRPPSTPVVTAAPLPAEGGMGSGPFVAPAVEPVKPWYMRYWVWGAASAAVVGGVAMAVVLTDRSEPPRDVWNVGLGFDEVGGN